MAEPFFTDRALQEAYRALLQRAASTAHIDEATWDLIVSGHLDPAGRDRVFDHVLECESCTRVWRGVLALKSEAETQELIPVATQSSWPRRRLGEGRWRASMMPLAAAAALVLVVGGAYLVRRSPEPDTLRSTGTLPTIGALMVAYTPDGVPAFVWAPVAEASRYRVEVFTDDGRPVWSREVERPPARWPDDVPRAKGPHRWRVEALAGDHVTARSAITTLEIAR